jgi:hypothetical protein
MIFLSSHKKGYQQLRNKIAAVKYGTLTVSPHSVLSIHMFFFRLQFVSSFCLRSISLYSVHVLLRSHWAFFSEHSRTRHAIGESLLQCAAFRNHVELSIAS